MPCRLPTGEARRPPSSPLAVFLTPYDKLQRRYLKAALSLFGSADDSARVQAVLLVRSMALVLPQPSLDNCLKARRGRGAQACPAL